jgi:hypothetical protein
MNVKCVILQRVYEIFLNLINNYINAETIRGKAYLVSNTDSSTLPLDAKVCSGQVNLATV